MKPRLLFVVNTDWFFVSHRLPIAEAAIQNGYEVHVACSFSGAHHRIEAIGAVVHPLNISRGGRRITDTWREFRELVTLYKTVRPDIVHLVTIKPVLLGGIAARWQGVRAVVAAISGLGFIFLSTGWKAEVRRLLVGSMYRLALAHPRIKVIFQNPDDCQAIQSFITLPENSIEMIRGSGVDLEVFRPVSRPLGMPIALMASRLLKDKGVREFAKAAELLKSRGVAVRCCLVGEIDPSNPSSFTPQEVLELKSFGHVELWGHRDHMEQVLPLASVVVLPSYREGLPKVLLEAAACGRAVVTCDVPGCRDAIDPGRTGLLVPVRDSTGLADAIQNLLGDATACEEMGREARVLAERSFSVKAVAARHLALYEALTNDL
ncbi:glycosyltransferase family 4 protein [Dechloromonas agitata]|uniref:glycosyltransferase family 4 protein n=1 Tax=Dechloromonas agitata TaxID=73030 RepID=UPI00237E94B4|nr:glycosyltransferase family 4 protein [Dechloromonas agitata]MDE1546486.1 glycosyltransferase family 4 protein [Dechloromonas agitata]